LIDARVMRTAHPGHRRSATASGERGGSAEDRSVRPAASLARIPVSSSRKPSVTRLSQARIELERVAFRYERDLREPRMQGIDDQVVFGRLDV